MPSLTVAVVEVVIAISAMGVAILKPFPMFCLARPAKTQDIADEITKAMVRPRLALLRPLSSGAAGVIGIYTPPARLAKRGSILAVVDRIASRPVSSSSSQAPSWPEATID